MQHREEEALQDIASTRISPTSARVLVAAFLILMLAVPLFQIASDLKQDQLPVSAEAGALLVKGLPQVAELKSFEERLEERDFLRKALLGPSQELLLRLGAGNERAWVGRDGFLFYRDSMTHLSGPSFLDPRQQRRRSQSAGVASDSIAAISDFQKQLVERGIDLIVVPVPVKASLYPDHVSARFKPNGPPLEHPALAQWRRELASAGVKVVDLLPVLAQSRSRQLAYLKSDTHWTPSACADVAAALAPYLGAPAQAVAWRTRAHKQRNLGDVAVMLRLPEDQRLVPDETVVLNQVLRRDGSLWQAQPQAEILVLGDSYTNMYSMEGLGWGQGAGLAEQLALAYGGELDRIAINDQGAKSTRAALAGELARGNDRLAGKRLVIWEFSERELSLGDWRLIKLPKVSASAVPPATRERVFKGTITAITPAPKPGSVPYADGIISLVVTNSEGEQLLAYTWGLRHHQASAAASWQVGDSLELELSPWPGKHDLLGYQRSELNEAHYQSLAAYWLESVVHRPGSVPTLPKSAPKPEPKRTETGQSDFAKAVAGLSGSDSCQAVGGSEGWVYFLPELRHLAMPAYWGEHAVASHPNVAPEVADPLAAIVDFKRQLDTLGVDLILMPVPAKASIYPEHLPFPQRPDSQDRAFIRVLQAQGVNVLDLLAVYEAHRNDRQLYLKSDTHWSPAGIALAAQALAERIAEKQTFAKAVSYSTTHHSLQIKGDLSCASGEGEQVSLERVVEGSGRRAKPPKPDRESPVLLLGDSHTLVFHAGEDLFASGAGLPDQLALNLGFAIDLIGIRGSGATTVRLDLQRRNDQLQGKKVVIWVFTAREFTQSQQGWSKTKL